MLTKVIRYATEKITSVEDDLLEYQAGKVTSAINSGVLYIPNPFNKVLGLTLTPLRNGTDSANGTGLFTTLVGYEVESVEDTGSNIPDFAANTKYFEGSVVKYNAKFYYCHTAYTSGASETMPSESNWVKLNAVKFIKVVCTAPGANKVVHCFYKAEGYRV